MSTRTHAKGRAHLFSRCSVSSELCIHLTIHFFLLFSNANNRVAKYHCTNIVEKYCDGKQQPSATDTSTCNATRQYNPGCFPNAAIAYKGCLDTCDFPAPMVNMTCPQNLVVGHTHNQHLTGGNKSGTLYCLYDRDVHCFSLLIVYFLSLCSLCSF